MKVETLTGPILLFATLLLVVCKTASLLGHPIWMAGIVLCMALAAVICYWGYQEIKGRMHHLHLQYEEQVHKNEVLRTMFDDAQGIRREKVAQLEAMIQALEKEQADQQKSYAQLYEQSAVAKSQAHSFKASLEEALNELRFLRQEIFFNQERMGRYPKDLPQRHDQLRAQFEEKSAILDQTRKRLFQHEGYLVVLQKMQELQRQELNGEQMALFHEIKALIEENCTLEEEVKSLEQLVIQLNSDDTPSSASLFSDDSVAHSEEQVDILASAVKKKRARKKGKKSLEKMLEFQFEDVT